VFAESQNLIASYSGVFDKVERYLRGSKCTTCTCYGRIHGVGVLVEFPHQGKRTAFAKYTVQSYG
jgi:hypothetical protein